MRLASGENVTPTVRLVRQLGEGGMGSVWLADHTSLRTEVVVKFMASALANDRESLARFSREAAAASQVKSPHVVQVFDHGVTDTGVPFIIMERLEGEDLAARLEREGSLPPRDVVTIAGHVCLALSRAHSKSIVHRDVKPQNIFLCTQDEAIFVKLLDFGIAKSVAPEAFGATRTGQIMGSPYYMSPEQAVGKKEIDHRTDLWSLGVVVFEAITGQRPFEGTSISALAIAIHSGPIPKPSDVRPGLPAAFDAWFARACSREVSTRFSSAKEMHRELARAFQLAIPTDVDSTRTVAAVPSASTPKEAFAHTGMDATLPLSSAQGRPRTRTMIFLLVALVGVAVSGVVVFRNRNRPPAAINAPAASLTHETAAPTTAPPPVPAAVSAPPSPSNVSPEASASSKPRRPPPPVAPPRAPAAPSTKPTGERPLF